MAICVTRLDGIHRLAGDAGLVEIGNRWLGHLEARRFSPATVRGYAYDLVCLARFLDDAGIGWFPLMCSTGWSGKHGPAPREVGWSGWARDGVRPRRR